MPVPPPTFTKSKWLTFFAELTSKITHHNVLVVIEGCEILKRLLISRVSVAAFLEEGNLLQHLFDTAVSVVKCEKPPTSHDGEMLHGLMQCLSLLLDMMMSLFADGDPYHTLLVQSRSSIFLDGLTQVLKGKNRQYFGFTSRLLQILLSLPLTTEREPLPIEDGIAAIRHVRQLEDNCKKLPLMVQHLYDVTTGLASVVDGAMKPCCWAIAKRAAAIHPKIDDVVDDENTNPSSQQLHALVIGAYDQIRNARCHDDCIHAINNLWCCFVANGEVAALSTGVDQAATLERFLRCAPKNSSDEVLFRSVLGWFALLISTQPITVDLQKKLLDVAVGSLIPLIGGNENKLVMEKPSTGYAVIVFLLTLAPCCPPTSMHSWLTSGLLGHIERLISKAASITSVLVDAPSTVDGSLPDEVYLSCALKQCRTETAIIGIVGMKLLCYLLQTHSRTMIDVCSAETMAMIQTVVPVCLNLVINNPTLQSAGPAVTLLHHYPKCHRACRPTSIGEIAAITLDSCFALGYDFPASTTRQLVQSMSALQRATKDSVQPHLRAATTRCLLRLCTSCSQLVMIVKEMPSVIPQSISTILNYSSDSAQWEAAGCAEWLCHVLQLASEDRGVDESLHISQSSLPLQLLQIVSKNPISYPTAAMMNLVGSIAEQQARLQAMGYQFQSVLYPHGTQSLPQWVAIIKMVINVNVTLSKVARRLGKMATVTKDAFARAIAAFEELSVQFAFSAACLRGIRLLFRHNPTFCEMLEPELMGHLFTSIVVVPPPAQLAAAIGNRFSVDVNHSSMLQRVYEGMMVWCSACMTSWFNPAQNLLFPALPEEFAAGVVTILSSDGVSNVARGSLCRAVSAIVSMRSQRTLVDSLEKLSKDIFVASLGMKESDAVHNLRCRMVTRFPAAAVAACSTGWLSSVIQQLHEATCTLRLGNNASEAEMDELTGLLAQVTSVVSAEDCRPLPPQDSSMLGASLCTMLHIQKTRVLALKATRSIANGPEGRAMLLLDSSEVDKMHRSVFAKLIQLTFGTSEVIKTSDKEVALGTDAISTAAAKGRDIFAQALIKLKALGKVEETLVALDRQRAAPPAPIYRFLASISFTGEVQCLIARRPAIMTLAIEAASLPTEVGTLALLMLRNCCFFQGVKAQLCQDSRFLQLLGETLARQPSSLVDPTHAREAYRKQQLATNALWALVYQHQRGKTYVRGLLQQPTQGAKKQLKLAEVLAGAPSSSPGGAGSLPQHSPIRSPHQHPAHSKGADYGFNTPKALLPGYELAMKRNVQALGKLGLVT